MNNSAAARDRVGDRPEDTGAAAPHAAEKETTQGQRVCLISFDAVQAGHPLERHAKSLVAAGVECEIVCPRGDADAEAQETAPEMPDPNDAAPQVHRDGSAGPSYYRVPLFGKRLGSAFSSNIVASRPPSFRSTSPHTD